MEVLEFKVDEDYIERLDVYLFNEIEDISRSKLQKLIKAGHVLVNNASEKPSYLVKRDDKIVISIPNQKKLDLVGEDIPLNIIYEDEDIVVINKDQGMVIHPSPGHERSTLVNALLYHINNLSTINGDFRPGIVHRLDKDTSGVLVVAKNNEAHEILSKQFKDREVIRKYIALVHGNVKNDKGKINKPIGRHPGDRKKMSVIKEGREAISLYRVKERFDNYSLLEVELKTGRTHQIRVHMKYINYPIVGDPVYSNGKNEYGLKKQFLHAREISFKHPKSGEQVTFIAEIPTENKRILEALIRRRENSCL